ncbi:glycosyltransferase [Paracraurococcus lichenis]|uniref:Glycosyltransferase family 4 protein n=1 Tax=Paracraurococcus lichenis TaxID=3064888 RepID=A0ABT9EAH0_9PROT|nr:glycosyltransferase family 4 protein [Paracraurococcus sp. LOR1-02]MDO9713142.1 glycosyltransferase family 4 protein [Paracraurococcus sp. LOR1-02]
MLFTATAALAPPIARPEPPGRGSLTVAGYFSAMTGLGMAARRLHVGLQTAGLEAAMADLTGPLRQGPPGPPPQVPDGPGTLLVHVNAPMLPWALLALGRRAVAGKRVIGVWNWELPVLPADWTRGFRACHRIWVASRFVAEACRRASGAPVAVVPYPVPRPCPSGLRRADFGLPEDAFVALQVFDAGSSLSRKNPLGAIAAHRAAFGDSPCHLLVLKTQNAARAGRAWAEVAAAATATANVRVIDQVMPEADLAALMLAADAVLSLHRAEGFGFVVAEAMALGRPVVATGWSGNMDFMAGPGTFAVPWRSVPARDPQATYDLPGATWAEPDIAAAAAYLRRLAADPAPQTPSMVFPLPDYAALLR